MNEMYKMYTARKIQEARYAAYTFIRVQHFLHKLTGHAWFSQKALNH